jgi:hypothetical protein
MTAPSARLQGIRACVFDAWGTLFDFASAAARCEEVPGEHVARLAAPRRDKQLQYASLRGLSSRRPHFWKVTGDALDLALETPGIGMSRAWDAWAASPFGMRVVQCNHHGHRRYRVIRAPATQAARFWSTAGKSISACATSWT